MSASDPWIQTKSPSRFQKPNSVNSFACTCAEAISSTSRKAERQCYNRLTQLYDAIGYINMVPEPGLDIDDTSRIIDLTIKIDEGPQYRVGKIDFLGLDEKTQSQLRPQLHPGNLYNPNLVDELLKRNKSLLPPDESRDDVSVIRTPKDHLVNLRFGFSSTLHRATNDPPPLLPHFLNSSLPLLRVSVAILPPISY